MSDISRERRPTHPGEILREDVLPALELSEDAAAAELKVKAEDLREVLSGKRRVDAEWALRFGRFCGNGPSFWLSLQSALDLWVAKRSIGKQLYEIPSHDPKKG